MTLSLDTIAGQLIAVFESEMDERTFKTVWTAHFPDKPGLVVSADSVEQAIEELHISLEAEDRFKKGLKK